MAEMQKMKKIGFRPRPIRKNQKNCISAMANSQKSKKLHFGHGRFAESRVFLLAFIQEK